MSALQAKRGEGGDAARPTAWLPSACSTDCGISAARDRHPARTAARVSAMKVTMAASTSSTAAITDSPPPPTTRSSPPA